MKNACQLEAMRHTTLLLAFAALAFTSCSLQLDSQYGLRWEPKTHAVPNTERSQKSTSAPETALAEPAAPYWYSIELESTEALQTNEGEDNIIGNEVAELVGDINIETFPSNKPQFEPQIFISEQEESVVLEAITESTYSKPTRAIAIIFAILLILAGLFGLFWSVVAVVFTILWELPILITLIILALTILFFWLAVIFIKIAKSVNGRTE